APIWPRSSPGGGNPFVTRPRHTGSRRRLGRRTPADSPAGASGKRQPPSEGGPDGAMRRQRLERLMDAVSLQARRVYHAGQRTTGDRSSRARPTAAGWLEVGNEATGALLVRGRDQRLLAELALPLGRLPLEQVLLPPLGTHQLAGAGGPDSLRGTPLRLDLRHGVPVSLALLRGEDHDHVPPLESRVALDRRDVQHVLGHAVQQPAAELGVDHLPPAEPDRDLSLVPVLEEAADVPRLELEVVLVRLRAHLDFLDLNHR